MVAAVATLHVLIAGSVARQGGFFADDLLFMMLGRQQGLTWDYLTRSAFGHLTPAYLGVAEMYRAMFGTWFAPALVIMVGVSLASTIAVLRLMRELAGQSWITLLCFGLFALGPISMHSATWWSYSLTAYAGFAFGVAVIGSSIRWERSRSWKHLVGVAAATACSLGFWEKGFLTPVYVVMLIVFVVDRGRISAQQWRERWPLLVTLAVFTAPFVLLYVTGPYAREAGAAPSLTSMLEFLALTVPEGLLPAALGFQYPYVGAVWLVPLIGCLLLLALITYTSWRSRQALVVWVFVAISIVLNQVLLARARVGMSGIHLGRDFRYQLDSLLFLIIGVGASLRVALLADVRERGKLASLVKSTRVAVGLAALLGAFFVFGSIRTLRGAWDVIPAKSAREYFEQVRDDWNRYERESPSVWTIVDNPVQTPFMLAPWYPWTVWSRVGPLIDPDIRSSSAGHQFLLADATGHLAPSEFSGQEYQPDSVTGGDCVSNGDTVVTFSPPEAVTPQGGFVHVQLASEHPDVKVAVYADVDGQRYEVRGTGEVIDVTANDDQLLIWAPSAGGGPLTVHVVGASGGCVLGLAVGTVGVA